MHGKKYYFYITIFAGIILISYLNFLTPLFADDFSYSVSWVTKEQIHSLAELFQSQYLHYYVTNGRSIIHTLAQILLRIGKPILNIINGITFSGLCLLICFHGVGSWKKVRSWHYVFVFTVLWFVTPHFGGSYLWVMGAANYMYSPLIILLYLIPYRIHWNDDTMMNRTRDLFYALIWFPCGIISGWTNENTSLALIALVGFIAIVRVLMKKRLYFWMCTGFIGNIIGSMLLFFSPAQGKRLAAAGGMGTLETWRERFVSISCDAKSYLWILFLLLFILAALYVLQNMKTWKRTGINKELLPAIFYIVGFLISLYSMVGSPEFPVWVWSSIIVFLLISVLNVMRLIKWNNKLSSVAITGVFSVACIGTILCSTFSVLPELQRVDNLYKNREEQINLAIEMNEPLVVELITTECTYSSYSLFSELSEDSTVWPNTAVANYYNIPSISLKETE